MNSSYYPPRANRVTRALAPWFELRRFLRAHQIQCPAGLPFRECLLSLVLPGWAFIATQYVWIGRAIMASYALGALLFLPFLGFLIANICFGLMIGAHATSILWLINYCAGPLSSWVRLGTSATVLCVLGAAIYWPSLHRLETTVFTPLRTPAGVVVVHPSAPGSIKRGDTIIYRIGSDRAQNVVTHAGYGIERIVGVAGDRIGFTPRGLCVNGHWVAHQLYMPAAGSLVVPKKHWYVWPSFDIQFHGNVAPETTAAAFLAAALVPQSEYLGKPFRYWFGRRQPVP